MTINNSKEEQTIPFDDDRMSPSTKHNGIVKNKNPRSNLTAKKYQKQINWRRNKVRELLYKGYNRQEIISILHVSQPTISGILLSYPKNKKEKLMTMESYSLRIILML